MSKQTLGPGDVLVRAGAVTFLVGAVGTVVTVAPLLLHTSRLPTPAYFVSMLMGVGLALALCGLLKAALAQRHAAAASAAAMRELVREREQVRERAGGPLDGGAQSAESQSAESQGAESQAAAEL